MVTPVGLGLRRHWVETNFLAHQSVRYRLCRAARAAAVVLGAGCAVSVATFLGGAAFADPVTPSPSPSTNPKPTVSPTAPSADVVEGPVNLQLALTPPRGMPGTSFTAVATGTEVCDRYRSRAVYSAPLSISFEWPFGHQSVTSVSNTASVAFTVPESAASDAYQVSASCDALGNGKGSATFTVTAQPSLVLSPQQGTPGRTLVTATTKGFDACLGGGSSVPQALSWQWDGGPLQTSLVGADASMVTFNVPADATPSAEHTVTASCNGTSAKSSFTVIPIATPTLRLDKSQGPRGTQLEASGTGFACGDDRVTLLWDGKTSLADGTSDTFSVPVTVPADTSISQHTVVASCRNHPDLAASQSFTVTADTIGAVAPAALALAPARGAPHDVVHITGDRFACTDSRVVELSWDGRALANASADTSGHFDTTISVPADAQVGSHTARAACATGSAAATAGFTVVITGTIPPTATGTPRTAPPPPPPPRKFGWLVLLIIGIVAVAAYRRWRKRRPKPLHHVYATVSPSSRPPLVSTQETPAHGELTHALRLQVHADIGIQTISEVDSDDTTQ